MKKKLFISLLAGAMMLSCAMVAGAEAETEAATEAAGEAAGELSDDLYSFQVMIDGEVYAFPMSYADFIAKGWTCSADETQELTPNSYTSEAFEKGDVKIYADFFNLGLNTVPFSECMIGGIDVDPYYIDDASDISIELPKGITYKTSTLDDIKAAYGEPSDTYEGELYTKVTYEYDSYQDIHLYVDLESGVMNQFDLRNFVYDAEANSAAAAEVSSEPTPEVLAYEAPTELGDDLLAFTADFAGTIYKLPAPVSVFLENGWTLKTEDSDSVVAGTSFGWVALMKDNQELRTTARNYNANATTIENCFITDIEANVHGPNLPMTIQKGITMGMSGADLEAALDGVSFEKEGETDTYVYYNVKEPDSYVNYVQILYHKDEDKVTAINVQYEPRSLD